MKKTDQIKKNQSLDLSKLLKNIESLKNDLIRVKMDVSFGKTKNIAQIDKIKKEIARMGTIANEKIYSAREKNEK